MTLEQLFAAFWQQYTQQNTSVQQIYDAFVAKGETVVNDHIALRTFSDPRVDISVLAKPFLELGYKEGGEYHFPVKKLYAKHYEHPDSLLPKVFISQLQLEAFSPLLVASVQDCLDQIPSALLNSPKLLYAGRVWQPISYTHYQTLLEESEYAAWLLAFGYCANHFTINVNQLKHFREITEINQFVKSLGFTLNTAGGEVKGSPAELLEQSSTQADKALVMFAEGQYPIPSCYYEFAKRYPKPNGELYSGFVAASADKIFESTHVNRAL